MFGNDNAINPVIGVVIMVAITVILAAVIAFIISGYAVYLGGVEYNKTITIQEITTISGQKTGFLSQSPKGIIDTESKGYILTPYVASQNLVVNGTYHITYTLDSESNTRVITKIEAQSLTTNTDRDMYRYKCILVSDGVCK